MIGSECGRKDKVIVLEDKVIVSEDSGTVSAIKLRGPAWSVRGSECHMTRSVSQRSS